uniref:Uncharacterized protein LOC104248553 n=1 Tax=Nicotiana sylvestris TaxID=4096 RepID=A0A1U7YWJ6_NICSY|nr:PREDICTED: uncharacterized protein LOC104248553 [Nicotiana sylvestris]XP_009803131.1 PREDICTED: uncharacterized protein LOC104248553 [Nicotiana sylvestris]XP_009803132.1 PREDICTED: uncharacterized protein LOC104248553 [Nicotiana sylvestris]XP_009803133.1 PREDICTED: uncharacterized protein LOC104248553 [Nicotiana sylvestris]
MKSISVNCAPHGDATISLLNAAFDSCTFLCKYVSYSRINATVTPSLAAQQVEQLQLILLPHLTCLMPHDNGFLKTVSSPQWNRAHLAGFKHLFFIDHLTKGATADNPCHRLWWS